MIDSYEEVISFAVADSVYQVLNIGIFEAFNKCCYSLVGCARKYIVKNESFFFKDRDIVIPGKVNNTFNFSRPFAPGNP